MSDMFKQLAAPFPPERVSWRVGTVKKDGTAAMALAYIDARDVMERLDEVCGPPNWQCRYPHANGKTVCEVGIKIDGEWVWKSDGAGDSDIEAEKGALSDAFKRAAVRWGVGRYLYDVQTPWVRIDSFKKILPEELKKLEGLLRRPAPAPQPVKVLPDGVMTGAELLEQQEGTKRKSSRQAKADGDDEKIKADIHGCDLDGLREWEINFDRWTAHLPVSWLDSIQNEIELRREELNGVARIGPAAEEMDEAFRGAVGGPGSAGISGRQDHPAAA